ncbi:MAG: hypothetical protein KJO35_08325 [Gammaproteobacteria bacterium]|nr:hypothetical protein [Gammaproteobacteria bacterium]NNF65932.1 hypothetical protein [Gammaproteobacteria bacterium]
MKYIPVPSNSNNTAKSGPAGRRFLTDRRQKLSPINFRHLGLQGRRQGFRRSEERTGQYVDWYEPKLMFLGVAIILCSCMDAFLTLNLMQMGAVEMNVLMARLIETNIQHFVNAKIALTCLCVTLLVIHKNFRVCGSLTVEHLLQVILACYLTLMGWEVMMFLNPPF